MAYIGKTPVIGNFQKCDAITVVNGQAAYTMQVGGVNVNPESENHMLVSLNGVLQAPVDSFTISGSTITFASNLATGDVIDFIMLLGNVLDLGTPSDNTVSLAKLTASGTKDATTFLRGDNTFAEPSSSLVKVHTITASDSANVSFSSTYLTSTYARYVLEAYNIQSASDDVYLQMHFSTDNGSSYTPGTVTRINISNTSSNSNDTISSRNTSGSGGLQLGSASNFGTGTGEVGAFTFQLVNFSDTNHYKLLYYNGALYNSSGVGGINAGASTIATTSAINNIKFDFNSGNIAAGTFILYGIN